ncbi:MAG: protein-L-isoaspartate(D-aspartate) O-methyltransferase [Pseudomonadales bacterium]|nr:protein-L-isoaspartate(D-aspartate) O-methyltransferase [Pseudomonadales bacterium]
MAEKFNLRGSGMTSQRARDRLVASLEAQGIMSTEVLKAIQSTPRHIFIDEALAHGAYENNALPIGFNQTISQPYIVAKMTELLLANKPVRKVLEVGTGSGYQTAILAQLVDNVYSVERIKPLQERAKVRLQAMQINNVTLQHSDGGMGLAQYAPYDAILVTAAADQVPAELLTQLAIGGTMVIPVGADQGQQLKLIIKKSASNYQTKVVEAVNFVPLLSGIIS